MNKNSVTWEAGDIAICVFVGQIDPMKEVSTPPLILHQEYTVLGTKTCKCGHVTLDIGIFRIPTRPLKCSGCNRKYIDQEIWYASSQRFVKKEQKKDQHPRKHTAYKDRTYSYQEIMNIMKP